MERLASGFEADLRGTLRDIIARGEPRFGGEAGNRTFRDCCLTAFADVVSRSPWIART